MQISAQSSVTRSQDAFQSVHFYYAIGASLIVSAFAILALDVLSLGIGQSIAVWQGLVGMGLGIAFIGWQQQRFQLVSAPIVVLIFVILGLVGVSLVTSGLCYDISWDGQTYHQEAILQLAQGWNPIYTTIGDSNAHSIWLNHYTKASWFLAANLYQLTGQLETAKAFNLIFLLGALFLSIAALRSTTSRAWIVALLLALNPVAISQAFSFTVDGQVASLLLCLGASLYAIALQPQQNRQWLPLVMCSIGLLANIKFTSLVYAVIFVAGFLIWLVFKHRKLAGQIAIVTALTVIISVVGLGYQPYVTNTLQKGQPFYPLAGAEKIDIISSQIPVDFVGKNRVEKFVRSIFSESDVARNTTSKLKFPLSLKRHELVSMMEGGRVGGFGPWFAAALCLAGLIIAMQGFKPFLGVFAVPCIILISAFINPEAWWARYVPQVWLLAPVALLIKAQNRLSLVRWALILVLSINCLFVIAPSAFATVRGNWLIEQQLQKLVDVKQVAVSFDKFGGNRSRFIERSIAWKEVKAQDLPCSQPSQFFLSNTRFCVVSK